jgi:hypothetical protein
MLLEKLEQGSVELLPTFIDDLSKLFNFYKPCNITSQNIIESGIIDKSDFPMLTKLNLSKKAKTVITKISKTFNLDQIQSYQLYINYIKSQITNQDKISNVFTFFKHRNWMMLYC